MRENIQENIITIENEKIRISELPFPQKDDFCSIFHSDYQKWENDWESKKQYYTSTLDILIETLKEREKDVFNVRTMPECEDISDDIVNFQNTINTLISDNNQKSNTLKQDQNKDRENLRLNEVAEFLEVINYDTELEIIKKTREGHRKLETEYNIIQKKIENIELKIEELKISLKDERKGADKINEHLNHYFGHEFLKLVAEDIEGEEGIRFRIMRNDQIAYNLSEGECSLIAFCYFMAKLEDIDTKGKNIIIWIDDPVSSLDSNHIFFVFSLIECLIAKPIKKANEPNEYKYQQLFISTHNLDFLKYLKRLSMPKNQSEYFIIERSKENSKIILMPDYLKKYITEFNYLFHQIYKCSKADNTNVEHDCFYNFGNNLRKFLEAFLFYKYPVYEQDTIRKLEMFFGDDSNAVALTNRISNELSHLEHIFDRSMKPVDIPEIPKLADFVIKTIKRKDEEQYNALLKSIDEVE